MQHIWNGDLAAVGFENFQIFWGENFESFCHLKAEKKLQYIREKLVIDITCQFFPFDVLIKAIFE